MVEITYWKNKPESGLDVKKGVETIIKSIGGILDKEATIEASTSRVDTIVYTLDYAKLEEAQTKVKDKYPELKIVDIEMSHQYDDNPDAFGTYDAGMSLDIVVNQKS